MVVQCSVLSVQSVYLKSEVNTTDSKMSIHSRPNQSDQRLTHIEEVEIGKRVSILEQEDLTDDEDEEDDDDGYSYSNSNSNSQLSRPGVVSRDSTFGSAATTPTRNTTGNSPRDRTESNFTSATAASTSLATSKMTTSSKRRSSTKRRIARMGQRAASLRFSAHDFGALSPNKLKRHYKIGEVIHKGSGGRGSVALSSRSLQSGTSSSMLCNVPRANIHVCVHRETGIQRAVKIIKKCHRWNRGHGQRVMQEFKILNSLDHPNVLRMYEMFEGKRKKLGVAVAIAIAVVTLYDLKAIMQS